MSNIPNSPEIVRLIGPLEQADEMHRQMREHEVAEHFVLCGENSIQHVKMRHVADARRERFYDFAVIDLADETDTVENPYRLYEFEMMNNSKFARLHVKRMFASEQISKIGLASYGNAQFSTNLKIPNGDDIERFTGVFAGFLDYMKVRV